MFIDKVIFMERRFFFKIVYIYFTNGCFFLVLEVLFKFLNIIKEEDIESDDEDDSESIKFLLENISIGILLVENLNNSEFKGGYDWGSFLMNGIVNGDKFEVIDWLIFFFIGNKVISEFLDWGVLVFRFDMDEEFRFIFSFEESGLDSDFENYVNE